MHDTVVSRATRHSRSTRIIYRHDETRYHLYACQWFIAHRSVALAKAVYKTSHGVFVEYAHEIRSGPEQREWRLTAIAFKTVTSTPCNNICRTRAEGGVARTGVREHAGREGWRDINIRSRGFTAPFAWLPGLGRFCKTKCLVSKSVTAECIYTCIRRTKGMS